jgi:hypothetical protein
MILSEKFPFIYRGARAWLWIVRNNGYCWGEFETLSRERFSVSVRADLYERIDEDAARILIRATRRSRCVEPSLLDSHRAGSRPVAARSRARRLRSRVRRGGGPASSKRRLQ